nr:MAG TPA: hypothetical protein [Caudoviricetes sp.]
MWGSRAGSGTQIHPGRETRREPLHRIHALPLRPQHLPVDGRHHHVDASQCMGRPG